MYERLLLPLDGSACSEQAMEQGLALARQLGAAVTFLYVAEDPFSYLPADAPAYTELREDLKQAGQELLDAASSRAAEFGVEASTVLVADQLAHPVQAILEAEGDHDLIVMGTHGRRGFNRWLFGSVTEGVLRRSAKPHLVIRCEQKAAG